MFHLGDYDPSGVSIFDSLAEDVLAFIGVDDPALSVEFRRVALTPEQVEQYSLPTAPPKASDSRSKGGTDTCQLEALPPDILAGILAAAAQQHLDMDIVRSRREEEKALRESLLTKIPEVA